MESQCRGSGSGAIAAAQHVFDKHAKLHVASHVFVRVCSAKRAQQRQHSVRAHVPAAAPASRLTLTASAWRLPSTWDVRRET